MLAQYIDFLKQQPQLASLPFARWSEVLKEADNWGLLKLNTGGYFRLQPTLPYFLRRLLQAPERTEIRTTVNISFRLMYEQIASGLYQLLDSENSQEQLLGQGLTWLEYENLDTALDMALTTQASILHLSSTLFHYLNKFRDWQRSLALGQRILRHLEAYPDEKMMTESGSEYVSIIDSIARYQAELHRFADAERSYQKALDLLLKNRNFSKDYVRHGSAWIYSSLGNVAMMQKHWADAERCHLLALQIEIDYNDRYQQADTYHNLGAVAQGQEHWTDAERYHLLALQIYKEYNNHQKQGEIYHNLGMIAQEQGQWLQAEQYYRFTLQIYREYNDRHGQGEIYHQLGKIAQAQGHWSEAKQQYTPALHIAIAFDDHHEQALTYHQLGVVAYKQRQWPQARRDFLQSLKMLVSLEDIYNRRVALRNLALLWRDSKDVSLSTAIAPIIGSSTQEVEDLLRKLLENDPANASAYLNQGNLHYLQEEWQQAIEDYTQAINLNPSFALAYLNRGNVYYQQEEWQQAIEDFTQAIELDPSNTSAYLDRGKTYYFQEQWPQAIEDYTKAVTLDPGTHVSSWTPRIKRALFEKFF